MDIYTDPSSNTYQLGKIFPLLTVNGETSAISVATSVSSLIIAAYAVLIQFLFAGLWQTVASVALKFFPLNRRTQYIGLIAFWNAEDPWTALWVMSKYVLTLLPKSFGGNRNSRNNLFGGICLWLLAATVCFGGLAASLLLSNFLVIGQAAPVHPEAVYLPELNGVSYADVSRQNAMYAPYVLRALGSTEAVDKLTISKRVRVELHSLPDLGPSQPQKRVTYSYNVTAEDFGLQTLCGLSYEVKGSCVTEYSWLDSKESRRGVQQEVYYAWNNSEYPLYLDPRSNSSTPSLHMIPYVLPTSNLIETNRSFAFLISTSHVPSFSASGDPLYFTEPTNGNNLSETLSIGYRVKAGRPALSCWEEALFCLDGLCTRDFPKLNLPLGVEAILGYQFAAPWPWYLASLAGLNSLKSYTGSVSGAIIDAETLSMKDDVERLIFASFLASRDAFRETTLIERGVNTENFLSDPQHTLLPGATMFNLKSAAITTFSFKFFIGIPIAFIVVWLIAAILSCTRRVKPATLRTGSSNQAVRQNLRRDDYKERAAALRATQLYRMLDEAIAVKEGAVWQGRRCDLPLPINEYADEENVPGHGFDFDQYGTGVSLFHCVPEKEMGIHC